MPTIVAVSRQFGSGGARVGRAVAQRLGFRYADREILAEAARVLHVDAKELEPLEERTSGVWERIGSLFALGSVDTPFTPPTLPAVSESQLFDAERQVIRAIAAQGKAVIVGRGAAHILGDSSDILRVFLHAPLHTRVALAMSEYGIADQAEADRIVRESDHARAKFVQSVSGHDWCSARLYDATFDTNAIGIDAVVDAIVGIVKGGPAASGAAPGESGNGEAR